jgi:hypothetical protein
MKKIIPLNPLSQFCLFNDPDLTVVAIETTAYAHGDSMAVLAVFANGERQPISVNIPPVSEGLPNNYFCAKNWSENEDLYRLLVENGILVPTGQVVPTGFVQAPVCKLCI